MGFTMPKAVVYNHAGINYSSKGFDDLKRFLQLDADVLKALLSGPEKKQVEQFLIESFLDIIVYDIFRYGDLIKLLFGPDFDHSIFLDSLDSDTKANNFQITFFHISNKHSSFLVFKLTYLFLQAYSIIIDKYRYKLHQKDINLSSFVAVRRCCINSCVRGTITL